MKRTPVKRKTPLDSRTRLERTTRIKPRSTTKRSKRHEDPSYLAHVRRQPCLVPGCTTRPIEAHHYGRRGLGQRCGDDEVAPLCGLHHRGWWHDKGHLPGMTPRESKELITTAGANLRAEWERR